MYQTIGKGSRGWITLLNGFTRTSNDFLAFSKHLERAGWGVVLIENRGTLKNPAQASFTLGDCAEEVVKAWDEQGISKSHVLGISYGGALAQTIALKFASRIHSLILVSTTPKVDWITSFSLKVSADHDLEPYFSKQFSSNNAILVNSLKKEMGKAFQDPFLQQQSTFQRIALKGFDNSANLSKVTIPTLIIHGEEDRVIPLNAAKTLASGISHSSLITLPQVGHLLLAECPKKLYSLVTDWLETSSKVKEQAND
jgi:pimeloyl-ACP methyl ester carboxylesterase